MGTYWRRAVFLVVVVVLLLALVAPMVWAQGCDGVVIRNDSSQELDEQRICEAAQPWVERGFQVFVYLTDYDPVDEDTWFDKLDQAEADLGIRDPLQPDAFSKSVIAFEATTITSHPWGHNVTFGEMLYGSPFDTDTAVGQIKGQMKNTIAAGDTTAAFVNAIGGAYSIAFPPPTPTPPPAAPVVVETGPTTEVNIDWRPVLSFIFWSVVVVALAVGLFFLVTQAILPAIRRAAVIQEKKRRLVDLAQRVDSLLFAADNLFAGDSVKETMLWKLFTLYGGEAYSDLAAQVLDWIERSRTALEEAFALNLELDEREPDAQPEALDAMIQAYEMVAITLMGTNEYILALDEDGLRNFVDPMTSGVEARADEAQLVAQMRQMREQLAERPLRIQFAMVDPSEVDADGVFGYANRVKEIISQLAEAREEAPKALEEARRARERAAAGNFPDGLEPSDALAAVDALLAKAETEVEAGRALKVQQLAEEAAALASETGALMPQVRDVVSQHGGRVRATQTIADQGFQLAFFAEACEKGQQIIAKLYARIAAGKLSDARRSVQNLFDESVGMLQAAQALVALYKENKRRLGELSQGVAVAQQYLGDMAMPAWEKLSAYPAGNHGEVAGHVGTASGNLARLFDDPKDAKDLASQVQTTNEEKTHKFLHRAEGLLDKAFADLHTAQQQLEAVVAQLTLVQGLEGKVGNLLASAEAGLTRAVGRRDRDDVAIDRAVDEQIEESRTLLGKAGGLIAACEFVAAGTAVDKARRLAVAAYASAEKQASRIATLYSQLEELRTSAAAVVRSASRAYNELTPAAQVATTGGKVVRAEDYLRKAKKAEAKLGGKEDRALAQALEELIGLYQRAQNEGRVAEQGAASDKREYDGAIASARTALSRAGDAISTASGYVRDSDAGGAGRTSLSQARSAIPSLPSYGAGVDAYRRLGREAERAQELANKSARQAKSRIREAEEARERERRRREEERRRREAEQRRQETARRASESARRSSSFGSSSRSSSFGSSSRTSSSRRR